MPSAAPKPGEPPSSACEPEGSLRLPACEPETSLRRPHHTARVRARALGLSLGRLAPGPLNAITDVPGVGVGHCTLLATGPDEVPIRTGVTAILPAADSLYERRMQAGSFVLNGAGEVCGLTQIAEWGLLETPILLTGTLSVNAVADALTRELIAENRALGITSDVVIPVVGECDDSWLHDARGCHVRAEHVRQALNSGSSGPVLEGNVGAGAGMMTCDFAGGIGSASRVVRYPEHSFTLGALVLSNFGTREELVMAGLPVGRMLAEQSREERRREVYGSIVVVLATDAPLLHAQLDRLCKRAALGIARTGGTAAHGSGEIVLAFSTQNRVPRQRQGSLMSLTCLYDAELDPLFQAAVEATEEAILNALCMAEEVTSLARHTCPALPLELVRSHVKRYAVDFPTAHAPLCP